MTTRPPFLSSLIRGRRVPSPLARLGFFIFFRFCFVFNFLFSFLIFVVPAGLATGGGTAVAAGEEFRCVWADHPPVIDGVAEEAVWGRATVIDRFRVPGTEQATPQTVTRARLLWDREAFYFFAEMTDHDLFADLTDHDAQTWLNDVFEIFLKPSPEAPGYYEFQVSAAGTVMDMFLPDQQSGGYPLLKSRDSFHLTTGVQRRGTLNQRTDRDQGWTVEGRIPWIDLLPTGGRPNVDEAWSVALCRYDYKQGAEPELSSCAPLSRPDFHRHQDYAILRFVGPRESRAAAQRPLPAYRPFTGSRVVGSPDPPLPFRAVRAFPDLKLNWPIFVIPEPGSRRLVLIDQKWSYGPARIARTTDDQRDGEVETLVSPVGVAYSVAFHPDFATNGWMYVGSTGRRKDDEPEKSRVVRYTLSREAPFAPTGDELTIIDWPSAGHNGAAVTFGLDGLLYVTSGDGTSDSDGNNVGQDLTTLLAKVLRIDVDHPADGRAYSVPADNPFLDRPTARPETWAYGLRNPWRISTDARTGDIWVGNNGQDMWEQAYRIERGANYGWSVYEGSHPFYLQRKLGPTPLVPPTVEHPHSEARSLTGGVVYYGTKHPELQGAYIYGDYSTGKIWGVKLDGKQIEWHREIADTTLQIAAISTDADGELLIVDHRGDQQGGLYHLEPNPPGDAAPPFPRRLSQTGLFPQTAGHRIADGLIPYSVNAPLWSDGAIKSRFIALPAKGHIDMTDQWAWQFPEETVLVKSFALETVAGDPASRRWIETRLMAKLQGEWVGYSYAWNEKQTDAELVAAAGEDRAFSVQDGAESRQQIWHYPSRAECMVCHTRAAGFVLGLSTLQMNKSHAFGPGIVANQLEVLEELGVLNAHDWVAEAKERLRRQLQAEGIAEDEISMQLASLKPSAGQAGLRSTFLLDRPPSQFPRLEDPYDAVGDLELRARSYLHANCAYCHIPAGGGNAQMDLSFSVSTSRMNAVNVVPLHHNFGMDDARLIKPGAPERSTLLRRMSIRTPGQMPQLATSLVDQPAVDLVREWISQLPATGEEKTAE